MPKVLDIWRVKFTFPEFGLKFVLTMSIKDLLQMSLVLFCIVAINKYIIKVNQNEIINVTRHYHIHKMLEVGWCITQSKRKHSVLKQPIPGDKSCLFTGIIC